MTQKNDQNRSHKNVIFTKSFYGRWNGVKKHPQKSPKSSKTHKNRSRRGRPTPKKDYKIDDFTLFLSSFTSFRRLLAYIIIILSK